MMGSDDPIVPPVNGRIIAAGLPQATLETVDCGHLFVLTRAAQTARRIERFMDQHAGACSP
jgi:pimeloyl-ACP methyl ester carboxylesterase